MNVKGATSELSKAVTYQVHLCEFDRALTGKFQYFALKKNFL